MATAYVPPGVNVTETISPTVSPLLASPADICIIGLAGNTANTQSALSTTDTLILSGTSGHVLPTLSALNDDATLHSVISVTNVLSPQQQPYAISTDYTVDLGEGPPDGTHAKISRVGSGTIPDGTLVAVTYTYFPADYWAPVRLFDIGAVEARFGPSWATASNPISGQTYYTGVFSQLSMAARIAFENGAQSVICQPLFQRATPGDPTSVQQAPANAAAVADPTTWADTLYVLRPIEDLNILVPIIGQDGSNITDSAVLNIFGQVQSHLAYMNSQQQFIVTVLGEDGTEEGVGTTASGLLHTMRTVHAPTLQGNFGNKVSGQCVLINNTVFQRATPNRANVSGAATTLDMGGQYAAAAVAGALGARPVSSSLTRKPILGFASVTDPRAPSDKNDDAAAGMFVVEQVGGIIRCRQALTLDIIDGPEFSELSVVRSKFLMVESIKSTLDNQIIGNIIADANSPLIVRSAISSVLSILQQSRVIVGYSQVIAALSSLNPTTITASFSYQAAFPVNFVNVSFSLDLTSGAVTVDTSGSGSSSGS